MSNKPVKDNNVELLVSYLDGELDDNRRHGIEERLATDQHFRDDLIQLQQTWDLLDELPSGQTNNSFTESTVSLVAARAEVAVQRNSGPNRWYSLSQRQWWLPLVTAGLAGVCGFLTVTKVLSKPDKQFEKDLPVIANVDKYLHADSLEFIRDLERTGLFSEETNDVF